MNHSFKVKLLSLVIVAAALVYYQTVIQARAALVAEREQNIAAVEAYNASVLALQQAAESTESSESTAASMVSALKDGVYEGKGEGFGGKIKLSLTVQDGKITAIELTNTSGEDDAYLEQAKAVIDEIIAAQSAEVDTVSGATCTADGIIEAAQAALKEAAE